LELTSLIVVAAIPVCAAFEVSSRIIALLGAVAIVLGGARQLFGWKESWTNRVKVRYAIEREIALFLARGGHYSDKETPVGLLVEAVEQICAAERDDWYSRHVAYEPRLEHVSVRAN
jgi:hypothetical protein